MESDHTLRIGISTIGRFHMFDLARQMVNLGQDVRLYTGYPKLKVDEDLKQISKVRPFWTVAGHFRRKIGWYSNAAVNWWNNHLLEDIGPWVARNIGEVDILDALAGTGWEAGRVLRDRGKPWICNRGSTHILTQIEILQEERRRWGLPPLLVDSGRPMERCLGEYAEADAIVVPASSAKRSFVEQGVAAEKVYICPYGVDVSMFHPEPKEDNRFRVVFVGGYLLRKGIGYLFEAVRPLVQKRIVELWLVGNASPEVREILHRNADIFIDKGPQPRGELSWFYSQGSVLVLPSVEEGLALVQAQAMACGLPVIATTNTGAEDLFIDGVEGFIVPIRDPKAIQDKIQWMLDNPLRRKEMGGAALQRVKSLGGWDMYGEQCLAIYHKVVDGKRVAA